MSREAKILIFGLVLIFSIYQKQTSKTFNFLKENNSIVEKKDPESDSNNSLSSSDELQDIIRRNQKIIDEIENMEPIEIPSELLDPNLEIKTYHPTPSNGFSPYDKYFGNGIYNNSSGNEFIIKNSNNTHAVVLLVNAYSGRKVRNEFVRKGSNFSMTGVPNGTYYLEWFSGNDWSPNHRIGNYIGGFQTDASFTKTREASDWMAVSGYQKWTVTLYSVVGGDVESESIDADEFFN